MLFAIILRSCSRKKKKYEKYVYLYLTVNSFKDMHPHVPSRSSGAYYALYLYIYIHILNFPILPETQIRYLPNSQKNLKSEIDGKPRLRITLSLSRSFITMLLEEKEPFLQFFPKTCLCMETGTQSLMTCYWNRSVGCLPQKKDRWPVPWRAFTTHKGKDIQRREMT